jgi:hypothetical protein
MPKPISCPKRRQFSVASGISSAISTSAGISTGTGH